MAQCYSAIYLVCACFALIHLICICSVRAMDVAAPLVTDVPGGWMIAGLSVAYIYTRCVATANYAHFQMVKRHAVPKERTEHKEAMYNRYTYEYVSRSDPRPRPKYEIFIYHHAEGLAGLCTCAFYGQSAGASPTPWNGRTWCKHIVGVALVLVDPATQVRILGTM